MSTLGKRIVIAGAGGFGRGVYGWIAGSPSYREEHEIDDVVFVDDEPQRSGRLSLVVSTIRDFRPDPHDEVICAIGSPRTRQTIVEVLQRTGVRFHTYIDQRAVLGSGVRVGTGSIICPGTVIGADVVIGNHVHVNFNCSLGHDTMLGDFTTLSPAVNIMGEVPVGRLTFVGGSAVVLPRIAVGDGAVIGAGAVVVRDVEPYSVHVGNPSRLVRYDEHD